MPRKRMLDHERKDACRNTGNLQKGGYQVMTCSWKKVKKMNNRAGRSHDRKLSSSLEWRTGLLTLDLVPRRGEKGIVHVPVSSREEFSVTFSYSVLISV